MMHVDSYPLGMSEEVRRLVLRGEAYRDGGIVRDRASGRIVCILTDAEQRFDEDLAFDVPIAPLLVCVRRMERTLELVQAELHRLQCSVEKVAADVDVANVKLDAQIFGRLVGALRALALDVDEGRLLHLAEHRRALLEIEGILQSAAEDLARSPERLRVAPALLVRLVEALLVAGTAACVTSTAMGVPASAERLASEMGQIVDGLARSVSSEVTRPRNLFWVTTAHLDAAVQLRALAQGAASHATRVRSLPASSSTVVAVLTVPSVVKIDAPRTPERTRR